MEDLDREFLPICDALFNVISLAAYFCDIVFDVLTAYSLCTEDLRIWSIFCTTFICLSMILSQILSLKWYKANGKQGLDTPCSTHLLFAIHISQCGVLWRYFRLFIPVDLRHVKNQVRDLCLLRLVHAFTEAAPMLLIQFYLMWSRNLTSNRAPESPTNLNIVSTALSLFNVCWALASFSKNIRRQNVHKLVLTWLGVIFQFLWRLGTVSSRVIALTVYATFYNYWVFIVIILHWLCMLMWLISPKNIFHGEKMSTMKKVWYSALIAVVYIFCYINVQETNSRQKLLIFYVTMFLENTLLFSVWLIAVREEDYWFKDIAVSLVFAGFLLGIAFMALYYAYFHVRKLSYAYDTGTTSTYRGDSRNASAPGTLNSCSSWKVNGEMYSVSAHRRYDKTFGMSSNGTLSDASGNGTGSRHYVGGYGGGGKGKTGAYNKMSGHHIHHPSVPGVFNCRFHPAMKRKKKKPTSFIPPPAVANDLEEQMFIPERNHAVINLVGMNGKMSNPFWKRPLSVTLGSENEGSVGSRVDIQQKLREKKQQQLAELREIEEEIKQGKLIRPLVSEISEPASERQPIPCEKKQPWFNSDPPIQLSPRPPIIIPPSDPHELVLDPSYLMGTGSRGLYEHPDWNLYEPVYSNDNDCDLRGHVPELRKGPYLRDSIYKSYRIPSDVDSQMSLPRSCTLPREFKFKRKMRKPVKTEHFLPSTNSSDGDVDSEEDPELQSQVHPFPFLFPSVYPVNVPNSGQGKRPNAKRGHRLHETKL